MKTYDSVETLFNVLGVGVGASMIKDVLGVVLLVLNVSLLLIKGVVWLIKWFRRSTKDGKIDDRELEELSDAINQASKYIEDIDEEEK